MACEISLPLRTIRRCATRAALIHYSQNIHAYKTHHGTVFFCTWDYFNVIVVLGVWPMAVCLVLNDAQAKEGAKKLVFFISLTLFLPWCAVPDAGPILPRIQLYSQRAVIQNRKEMVSTSHSFLYMQYFLFTKTCCLSSVCESVFECCE